MTYDRVCIVCGIFLGIIGTLCSLYARRVSDAEQIIVSRMPAALRNAANAPLGGAQNTPQGIAYYRLAYAALALAGFAIAVVLELRRGWPPL